MATENTNQELTIESMQLKMENQSGVIKQLTSENEALYQQFNHLMIRNQKLLKRVDDLQGIIDDLHLRIEELHLINRNMLQLNDQYRSGNNSVAERQETIIKEEVSTQSDLLSDQRFKNVFSQWKHYPGQDARNEPNLRKQVQLLFNLYEHKSLKAADLFSKTGIGGVTGARYVAVLKKFGLISYTGARKKGKYEMTDKGIEFITNASASTPGNDQRSFPMIDVQGIPVKKETKEFLETQFIPSDL